MAIIARRPESQFSPAPEGLHRAVCVDALDLGMVEGAFGTKHKVELRWQLEDEDPKSTGTAHSRPYMVSKRYTNSLHEKATLRHDLEAWRGKRFSPEELDGFDLEVLIGINCQLQVSHNVKDEGGVWANVQAIVQKAKGMPDLVARNYDRVKDRQTERDAFSVDPEEQPF